MQLNEWLFTLVRRVMRAKEGMAAKEGVGDATNIQ